MNDRRGDSKRKGDSVSSKEEDGAILHRRKNGDRTYYRKRERNRGREKRGDRREKCITEYESI